MDKPIGFGSLYSKYALVIRSYEATADMSKIDKEHWFMKGRWKLISRTEIYHTSLSEAFGDISKLVRDAEQADLPNDMQFAGPDDDGDVVYRVTSEFNNKVMLSVLCLIPCEEMLLE